MAYKSYLRHAAAYRVVNNAGGIGNPYRDSHGMFTFAPAGVKRGRYTETTSYGTYYDEATGQPLSKDDPRYGHNTNRVTRLNERGEQRYEYEKQRNKQRSKDKRVDEEALLDPKKWESEDLDSAINLARASQDMTKATSDLAGRVFKDPPRGPRYDLSNMSDQELRAILNREQMERQYNEYFNPQQVNRGRETVQNVLGYAGTAATIGLTALQIAKAVKDLR